MPTTLLPETLVNIAAALYTPVITLPARSTPSQGNNSVVMDTSSTNTPIPTPTTAQDRNHQVEVLHLTLGSMTGLLILKVDPYNQVP